MYLRIKYWNYISVTVVTLIRLLVHVYDIVTLPVYYLIQKPWIARKRIDAIYAKQVDPEDTKSPWTRLGDHSYHFLDECSTIDEAIRKSIEINGKDKQCVAYREVLGEETHQLNGKPITKYVLSDYKWLNYGQFDNKVNNISKGLLVNGVKSKDKVMIFADTCMDWFICAQSIMRIGSTVATIYSSLNDEGIIHGLNETEVTHVITSHHLLNKLIKLRPQIPKMSKIIFFDSNNNQSNHSIEKSDGQDISLIALSDLESTGRQTNGEELSYDMPNENDIAVLLYTSGSTGVPKGVNITHKNLLNSVVTYKLLFNHLLATRDQQLYIAYLPLAHILELIIETIMFSVGIRVGYSTPNTLTDVGTAIRPGDKGDATLLRPTLMAGVPLVLDRIRKGIVDKISRNGLIARQLFDFGVQYKTFWTQRGFDTPIMNRFVCGKFRATVGGKLDMMFVGGAPLSQDTQKVIKACLNIKLLQGYASTETSGAGCLMDQSDQSYGQVGAPLRGTKIVLEDWEEGGYRATDKPNPRGEIVISSDSISAGYYKLESATEEAYYTDADGQRWFRTGDIGEVYPNGNFKIIDRKKDLIKLSFGEYVSLGKIEAELKSNPLVDNICVYGHLYHSYLVALVVPNQLSVVRLAKRLKIHYGSYSDLCQNRQLISYITHQLRKYGANARLSKFEIPVQYYLCADEWTPDNGLVTAAMKLKRKQINNRYQTIIDQMYENSDNNNNNNNNS